MQKPKTPFPPRKRGLEFMERAWAFAKKSFLTGKSSCNTFMKMLYNLMETRPGETIEATNQSSNHSARLA
jgi:hypothetical protein